MEFKVVVDDDVKQIVWDGITAVRGLTSQIARLGTVLQQRKNSATAREEYSDFLGGLKADHKMVKLTLTPEAYERWSQWEQSFHRGERRAEEQRQKKADADG